MPAVLNAMMNRIPLVASDNISESMKVSRIGQCVFVSFFNLRQTSQTASQETCM